jgi:hypothetical protein
MDEFTKTMIAAAVGGGLAILGGIITKVLDFCFDILKEKRALKRSRREKVREEIEELKNQIGTIYELGSNWKGYEEKLGEYAAFFAKDHEVIGRCNKYPDIAAAARDTVHLCKVVAHDERERENPDRRQDLTLNRKELTVKYRAFIQACDKYLESLA